MIRIDSENDGTVTRPFPPPPAFVGVGTINPYPEREDTRVATADDEVWDEVTSSSRPTLRIIPKED